MPGVGIWFTTIWGDSGDPGNYSLLLDESGTWSTGLEWTNSRNRACMVQIDDETVAHIGGSAKPGNALMGYTIDTYNFVTEIETLNVTQMTYNRKAHSCVLIPVGESGNPTVAILGDNSSPFPYDMELWDTVTNVITQISHPPGYETFRFFKPSIATYDDTSFILSGSSVQENGTSVTSLMDGTIWQYKVGDGWINLAQPIANAKSVGEAAEQYDMYMLNNEALGAYDSLNQCP